MTGIGIDWEKFSKQGVEHPERVFFAGAAYALRGVLEVMTAELTHDEVLGFTRQMIVECGTRLLKGER